MNTTVFTDPEVGHFFNEHFINVKFDMEKGRGTGVIEALWDAGISNLFIAGCSRERGTHGSLADMMPVNLSG